MKDEDFLVTSLGRGNVISPLKNNQRAARHVYKTVDDSETINNDHSLENFLHERITADSPV